MFFKWLFNRKNYIKVPIIVYPETEQYNCKYCTKSYCLGELYNKCLTVDCPHNTKTTFEDGSEFLTCGGLEYVDRKEVKFSLEEV